MLLEHGIMVVERVLEKRLCGIVSVNEMRFGFILERGRIDAVLVFKMLQDVCHANMYIYYINMYYIILY